MADELAEAHARIVELEAALALVNGRLAESTQRADLAERGVETLTVRLHEATVAAREADARYHRLQTRHDLAGAPPAHADRSSA